ncbi:hypothetical protein BH23BAC1_BH23BAC1_21160 [soil metagenome]
MVNYEQKNDFVSIIMPLFNRADLMDETISSVINQAYSSWELIIVDDGSTDGSFEKALQYSIDDSRIKVFKRESGQKGASDCRNMGFEKAEGFFIIFLDSDDLLSFNCLENRIKMFKENKDYDFLVFPILLFQKRLNDINKLWNIDEPNIEDHLRFLKGDALWQTMGPIYKKEFLSQLPGVFDTNLAYWQDYDLHLRLVLKPSKYKKFLHLQPDCFHRIHASSISHSGAFPIEVLRSRNLVLSKIWALLKKRRNKEAEAIPYFKGNLFFNVLIKSIELKHWTYSCQTLWHYVITGLVSVTELFKFQILILVHVLNFEYKKINFKSLVSFFFKSYWFESKIGANNLNNSNNFHFQN